MKFACYIMWQFQRTTPRYDTSSQAKSPRTCVFSRGTVSSGSNSTPIIYPNWNTLILPLKTHKTCLLACRCGGGAGRSVGISSGRQPMRLPVHRNCAFRTVPCVPLPVRASSHVTCGKATDGTRDQPEFHNPHDTRPRALLACKLCRPPRRTAVGRSYARSRVSSSRSA